MAYSIMDFDGYASTPAFALRAAIEQVHLEMQRGIWELTSLSHSVVLEPKAAVDRKAHAQVVVVLKSVFGKRKGRSSVINSFAEAAVQIEDYTKRQQRKKKE